ncbi:MAG: MerR family transcriptional regulator [Acidimicrobiia bacterium]|nr:MerR family transcriptional regulator [Acidimicrobiia bacterium]
MAGSEPQPLADELTIGEAAARIGITTSALRFYEDKGLIQSRRTDGGQRRYARDVLRRVAFIRAAQSVGLSLTEIASCIGCGCLSLENCALFNPDDEAAAEGPGARYLLRD